MACDNKTDPPTESKARVAVGQLVRKGKANQRILSLLQRHIVSATPKGPGEFMHARGTSPPARACTTLLCGVLKHNAIALLPIKPGLPWDCAMLHHAELGPSSSPVLSAPLLGKYLAWRAVMKGPASASHHSMPSAAAKRSRIRASVGRALGCNDNLDLHTNPYTSLGTSTGPICHLERSGLRQFSSLARETSFEEN